MCNFIAVPSMAYLFLAPYNPNPNPNPYPIFSFPMPGIIKKVFVIIIKQCFYFISRV